MAHDPSFGFADYLSAADAAATPTLMPAMDNGAPPELYGLQTSMELLGMRGLHPAMPGAASAASAHCEGSGDAGDSTMRFFLEHQQQQQQAPLSLSLHQQHQQHRAPVSAWMVHEQDAVGHGHGHGAAWHLRSSRFLFPAQQLLEGFCSLPVAKTKRTKAAQQQDDVGGGGEGSSSSSSCRAPPAQIQAMDALELQRLKDKLYIMLEEVDRRYRRYCEQMRGLAGGFEAVAGERAAAGYTALASKTISRHFRSLRDGVVAQLQAVRKALGEKDSSSSKSSPGGMTRGDTPRLKVLDQCIRQHKAMHQNGGLMMETHPWRPQRGLPERAVTVLRAWLFEHFLHPYPSDVDKHILSRQTGLSRSQVSNWFINARVRLWKPMVEEMYMEEMKDGAEGHLDQLVDGATAANNNPSSGSGSLVPAASASDADRAAPLLHGDDGERKPTRAQLRHADADIGVAHDAGSLASVVNIGGGGARGRMAESFVVDMDDHSQFGFDAYSDADAGPSTGFGGGGVSLTLGLQQHELHDSSQHLGGVNIAFGAPAPAHAGGFLFPGDHQRQMGGGGIGVLHSSAGHGHHVQFGASAGDASNGGQHVDDAQHYRWLSTTGSSSLLRDLTG